MIVSVLRRYRHFAREETAATATEYAVMLALVLTVILTSVTLFGETLDSEYQRIDTSLFGS